MFIMLKSIRFARDLDARTKAETRAHMDEAGTLSDVHSAWLADPLPGGLKDGDVVWRVRFKDEDAYRSWLSARLVRDKILPQLSPTAGAIVDSITYRREWSAFPEPDIAKGIWRGHILAVAEGASPAARKQFEQDLMLLPRHVGTIRNWSLSRVLHSEGARRWTYVSEQEFHDASDLGGDYRTTPIHWAVVDSWFDVECPQRIITDMLHTLVPIERSIIA